jgi:hypothetical protein
MFAYEGLGCIYWHMVAKLLLAVQEQVFEAADEAPPSCRRSRRTTGACATAWATARAVAEYGAFPADPYSHTPAKAAPSSPA